MKHKFLLLVQFAVLVVLAVTLGRHVHHHQYVSPISWICGGLATLIFIFCLLVTFANRVAAKL